MEADNFLVIGITLPHCDISASEEAVAIEHYLRSGAVNFFHLRKPEASESEVIKLLRLLPKDLFPKLVLHSHYGLCTQFEFGGMHIKSSTPYRQRHHGFISRSCHGIEECRDRAEGYFYSFLSPIFDSISKPGYNSAFDLLDPLLRDTLRRQRVIALGGVTPQKFKNLFDAKFAGAALLGYLWSPKSSLEEKRNFLLERRCSLR